MVGAWFHNLETVTKVAKYYLKKDRNNKYKKRENESHGHVTSHGYHPCENRGTVFILTNGTVHKASFCLCTSFKNPTLTAEYNMLIAISPYLRRINISAQLLTQLFPQFFFWLVYLYLHSWYCTFTTRQKQDN